MKNGIEKIKSDFVFLISKIDVSDETNMFYINEMYFDTYDSMNLDVLKPKIYKTIDLLNEDSQKYINLDIEEELWDMV